MVLSSVQHLLFPPSVCLLIAWASSQTSSDAPGCGVVEGKIGAAVSARWNILEDPRQMRSCSLHPQSIRSCFGANHGSWCDKRPAHVCSGSLVVPLPDSSGAVNRTAMWARSGTVDLSVMLQRPLSPTLPFCSVSKRNKPRADAEVFAMPDGSAVSTTNRGPRVEEPIVSPFSSESLPRLRVYMTLQLCFHTGCWVVLTGFCVCCEKGSFVIGVSLVGCWDQQA